MTGANNIHKKLSKSFLKFQLSLQNLPRLVQLFHNKQTEVERFGLKFSNTASAY